MWTRALATPTSTPCGTRSSPTWSSPGFPQSRPVVGPALDYRPYDERLHVVDRWRPGISPGDSSPDPGARRDRSRGRCATGNGNGRPRKGAHLVPTGAETGAVRLASETSEPAPDCIEKGQENRETRRLENARTPGKNGEFRASLHQPASDCKAERAGFEPAVRQAPHRFSRPAHSAALAPLHLMAQRLTSRRHSGS